MGFEIEMKIWGDKEGISEFLWMFKWSEEYELDGLGSFASWHGDEDIDGTPILECNFKILEEGDGWVLGSGLSSGSIHESMITFEWRRTFMSETARLGLTVEAYSQKMGPGVQEHYIVDRGVIVLAERTELELYIIDDEFYSEAELAELAGRLGMTVEQMRSEGEIWVGGFAPWSFSDLRPLAADGAELA